MIVSALALSAIAVVRIERKQADVQADRLSARTHARSAVELALAQLNINPNWRTDYSNNVESTPVSLGSNSRGALSWKLVDADGSLTNADQKLWLKGIGRVGDSVQVSSLQVVTNQVGPNTLRSYTNALSTQSDDLRNDRWWGQYFKPTLPAEATGWRVTSVQLRCRRESSGHTIYVRIYANSLNPDNRIETAEVSSGNFPSNYSWYTINLPGAYWLNTTDTAYLTLETASSSNTIKLQYRDGGANQTNSALVRGNPSWGSHETGKALLYVIEGHYSTSSGVTPVAGSWIWDSL